MELLLSNEVIVGLKYLNTVINDEKSKKLISNSVKCLIASLDIPLYTEIYDSSESKEICQAEYSVLTLFSLAVKHSFDGEKLKVLLESHGIEVSAIIEIVTTYDLHRYEFQSEVCKSSPRLSKLTEVDWKLSCDVKTSAYDSSSGELSYKINLGNFNDKTGLREKLTEFICNPEELQSFINKLKDIERHCDKLNTII